MSDTSARNVLPASSCDHSPVRAHGSPEPTAAIKSAARSAVGRLSLPDAIRIFRNEMVDSALNNEQGSRRAAARVLGVTRPAVQHVLRHLKS